MLRWNLLPDWTAGSLEEANRLNCQSSVHFDLLLQKSNCVFVLDEDDDGANLSYSTWYKTLQTVAADRYWKIVPLQDRCTHLLNDAGFSSSNLSVRSKNGKKVKAEPEMVCSPSPIRSKMSKSPRTSRQVKKEKVKLPIEEIIISSSDSDGNSSNVSASDSDGDFPMPAAQYHRERRNRGRRYVVKPPVFHINDSESLSDFLQTFERYFSRKFDGSQYDQTQELGNFIDGELLQLYKIKGGRKVKYDDMKTELLKFYKKVRTGGKSYHRGQLNEATLNTNEALDMYGMRLMEMAKLAYPHSTSESAKHLRKQFMATIPTSIATKITDVELAMKATTNSKRKHMAFAAVMEMARDLQKNREKTKSVMWTYDGSSTPVPASTFTPSAVQDSFQQHSRDRQPANDHHSFQRQSRDRQPSTFQHSFQRQSRERQPTSVQRSFEFRPSNSGGRRSPESSGAESSLFCNYCKMTNHVRKDCWRASNLCLICGSKHHMEECPRFNKSHRSASRDRPLNY